MPTVNARCYMKRHLGSYNDARLSSFPYFSLPLTTVPRLPILGNQHKHESWNIIHGPYIALRLFIVHLLVFLCNLISSALGLPRVLECQYLLEYIVICSSSRAAKGGLPFYSMAPDSAFKFIKKNFLLVDLSQNRRR